MTDLSKYKKLTDVQHCLKRPGMYIGSTKPHQQNVWVFDDTSNKMNQRIVEWNPGLIKLFDEVISNSVDESARNPKLNTIKVDINRETGTISVYDNGGIPVKLHPEYKEYVPTMIFGYLRSGSNFDDHSENQSAVTGQNGLGSTLTNIFSTRFIVETSDGSNRFKQTWTDNMMTRTDPMILETEEPGFTRITFTPDYAHLDTVLNDDNYSKMVKRVYDIAGCNPKLKVYFNGSRIKVDSFKDYIKFYTPDFEYDENDDWQIGVSKSDDGFDHVSFVNSTQTLQGGSHIDYVTNQIVGELREYITKKYKLKDLKPSDIRTHMRVFINARIIKPRYDSQTKENLITEPREYKTSYKVSDKLIQKLIKSPIIESVLNWAEAKAKAAELAELKKLNKDVDKVNPKRILKLEDASWAGKKSNECYLFIAEGDSAKGPIAAACNKQTMGVLALKGKPINANTVDSKKIMENEEFFNIMAAIGLKLGEKVENKNQLRYANIVVAVDADFDGAHIFGLMINNLYKYWPELFEMGIIHRFFTPVIKVWIKGKKEPIGFETEREYHLWLSNETNKSSVKQFKYYKGLGTSSLEEFKQYLSNLDKHLVQITMEDKEDGKLIDLVFGKEQGSADKRKAWLGLTE